MKTSNMNSKAARCLQILSLEYRRQLNLIPL